MLKKQATPLPPTKSLFQAIPKKQTKDPSKKSKQNKKPTKQQINPIEQSQLSSLEISLPFQNLGFAIVLIFLHRLASILKNYTACSEMQSMNCSTQIKNYYTHYFLSTSLEILLNHFICC